MLKRNNIYLLYGEEKYDLNRKLESIKKGFDKLENGVNLFYITKDNIDDTEDHLKGLSDICGRNINNIDML